MDEISTLHSHHSTLVRPIEAKTINPSPAILALIKQFARAYMPIDKMQGVVLN